MNRILKEQMIAAEALLTGGQMTRLANAGQALAASLQSLRRAMEQRSTQFPDRLDVNWGNQALLQAEHAELDRHAQELAKREADLAALARELDERQAHAAPPPMEARTPAQQFGELLNVWLERSPEGRDVTATELHRELSAIAAERGLKAACLGHARSFGLRLKKYRGELADQIHVRRRHGARGRVVMTFQRVQP